MSTPCPAPRAADARAQRRAALTLLTVLMRVIAATAIGCGWPSGLAGRSDDSGSASGAPPAGSTRLFVLPEDGSHALVDAITTAKVRVWSEMYLLTDPGAIGALVAAHARGAEVRVLLEPSPYGAATANQDPFTTLAAAGIDVRWFTVPEGLVHAKVVLVDDEAWISTANLTTAGLTYNRELVARDAEPADVRRIEAQWLSDAVGAPTPEASPGGNDRPASRVLVAPFDARPRLAAAVEAARGSVALEVEELSDTDFAGQLIAARARGVGVKVVLPALADRSAATSATAERLAAAGIDVRATGGPPLHAKAVAIDDAVGYLGSVNFTRASFDDNREFGLLLADPGAVGRIRDTIGHDAATGTSL